MKTPLNPTPLATVPYQPERRGRFSDARLAAVVEAAYILSETDR